MSEYISYTRTVKRNSKRRRRRKRRIQQILIRVVILLAMLLFLGLIIFGIVKLVDSIGGNDNKKTPNNPIERVTLENLDKDVTIQN